jgi:hypothetical protein
MMGRGMLCCCDILLEVNARCECADAAEGVFVKGVLACVLVEASGLMVCVILGCG